MKLLKTAAWFAGAAYLIAVLSHFFNPNFEIAPPLLFLMLLLLFTSVGIIEIREKRKKTAVFYFLFALFSLVSLAAGFIRM